MRTISKVTLHVALVTSGLLLSQISWADNPANVKKMEQVKFVADPQAPATCQQVPSGLVYTYSYDGQTNQRAVTLPPSSAWKHFTIEYSGQNDGVSAFIDTAVPASDSGHPVHLYGQINSNHQAAGIYWQWQANGSRCFGTFTVQPADADSNTPALGKPMHNKKTK